MKIGFNIVSEVGNEINYMRNAIAKKHISGAGIYTKKCNNIYYVPYVFIFFKDAARDIIQGKVS